MGMKQFNIVCKKQGEPAHLKTVSARPYTIAGRKVFIDHHNIDHPGEYVLSDSETGMIVHTDIFFSRLISISFEKLRQNPGVIDKCKMKLRALGIELPVNPIR